MDEILKISKLNKKYQNKIILDNINLSIKKGEIVGLLGPNGAGKTTLMKIILNLINFDSGEVIFKLDTNNTEEKSSSTKVHRHTGAIIESPKLYTYMTGYENLYYFSKLYKDIDKTRIMETASQLKIKESLNKKVKHYSLGMKQRLGIAQAILHKPSLLILDEPMNGLDPEGMYELRKYIKEIAASGTSILISSHLLTEMELLCDKVAILHNQTINNIFEVKEIPKNTQRYKTIFEVSSISKFCMVIKQIFDSKEVEIINREQKRINILLSKQEVALLNKKLIMNNIEIYKVIPQTKFLEENYLNLVANERG